MPVNRKITVLFSVLFVSLFSAGSSYGWGKEGHHMVGEIGYKYMTKPVQDSVKKYLGTMSIDAAASWMDDIRGTDEGKQMAPWHYVNIAKGNTYVPDATAVNVVTEINKAYNNLKHRKTLTADQITLNIKVLIHLVGDIHQPLHAGYKEDQGGNQVTVTYNGQSTNLHSLWDGGIIRTKKITLQDCLGQYGSYTKAQLQSIEKTDDLVWLKQSRDYLPQVYNFQNGAIDDQYAELNKTVIEKQILCGGLRLAAMLNDAFRN